MLRGTTASEAPRVVGRAARCHFRAQLLHSGTGMGVALRSLAGTARSRVARLWKVG